VRAAMLRMIMVEEEEEEEVVVVIVVGVKVWHGRPVQARWVSSLAPALALSSCQSPQY